jgi:hypothetical protein
MNRESLSDQAIVYRVLLRNRWLDQETGEIYADQLARIAHLIWLPIN